MCNILKTADRRAKRMKIWGSWSYVLHMQGTFHVLYFEFSLGLFGALCKISDINILKRLLPSQSVLQFQPNFIVSMLFVREYRPLIFCWQSAKN